MHHPIDATTSTSTASITSQSRSRPNSVWWIEYDGMMDEWMNDVPVTGTLYSTR
jgi:hypothetical protein